MKTILKKELKFYLNNFVGYISIFLFSAFVNFFFVKDLFVTGGFSLSNFFTIIPWVFVFFIPALAMRLFADEKKEKTLEVLLSLPISESNIVLGKFFASLILVILGLILTLPVPIFLIVVSKVYVPEVLVGYLGTILLASAFLSLSMYFSSLTESYVVSFLSSVLVLFFLLVLQSDFVAGVLPSSLLSPFSIFLPLPHFLDFSKGLVELDSVFYFLSFASLFIFLTVINLERRD